MRTKLWMSFSFLVLFISAQICVGAIAQSATEAAAQCINVVNFQSSLAVLDKEPTFEAISYNLKQFGWPGQPDKSDAQTEVLHLIEEQGFGTVVDLFLIQEIWDVASAEGFNVEDLDGRFNVYSAIPEIITHMQPVQLFTKRFPLDYEKQNFSKTTWVDPFDGDTEILFKKGLGVVIARPHGAEKNSLPLYISIAVHLKSMIDRRGDKRSVKIRTKQADVLADIVQAYQKKYGMNVPILIAGDFNGVQGAPEFDSLFGRAQLEDVFDLMGLSADERITQVTFLNGKRITNQLDKIMISRSFASSLKKAGVRRYGDGKLPENFQDRDKQPSDHFPIFAQFDMKMLMKFYHQALQDGAWRVSPF